MNCPHCKCVYQDEPESVPLGEDQRGSWVLNKRKCPQCDLWNFSLRVQRPVDSNRSTPTISEQRWMIHPKAVKRPPVPDMVPAQFAEDYREACLVLADSPKASAALSRRCLQNLLREMTGIPFRGAVDLSHRLIRLGFTELEDWDAEAP